MSPQQAAVLSRLKLGLPLTHRVAEREHGIMRLAARIEELRRMGYHITRELVTVGRRDGGRTRIARYWLKGENNES